MEDVECSGLLYPYVEYITKSGEVFLKMKRKDEWGPTFYVFEKNEELLSEEEKTKFKEDWRLMTTFAGKVGINLFDSLEIEEALHARMKEILDSEDAKRARAEADETGKLALVNDMDISVYEHGTRRIVSLNLRISVPAGASETIKEFLNVGKGPPGKWHSQP